MRSSEPMASEREFLNGFRVHQISQFEDSMNILNPLVNENHYHETFFVSEGEVKIQILKHPC